MKCYLFGCNVLIIASACSVNVKENNQKSDGEHGEKPNIIIYQNKDAPFFLFLSMHQNHVPSLPNPKFYGSSDVGLRGDCVVELDWIAGEITRILKETNLLENTLLIFTSDNGPVLFDGYDDGALENHNDHDPNGGFRGGKYIASDGGTRMPTTAYWPSGRRGLITGITLVIRTQCISVPSSPMNTCLIWNPTLVKRIILPVIILNS